jgi:hypothetical protein
MILFLFTDSSALAQVDTENFHQALKLKKNFYLKTGVVSGGDSTSSDFVVKQIRSAKNPEGYDRLVIELSGNEAGGTSTLKRPPYYQVQVDSATQSIHATLYGKPKLDFSAQSTVAQAKKTTTIEKINLMPMVDADRWTWTIKTRAGTKAEVFELTDPARIIVDLK